jgi:hypothetical protein
MVHVEFPQYGYLSSLQWCYRTSALSFLLVANYFFLITINIPPVARDVFFPLPAAVRLLETEGRHFSKFTVICFLSSTKDASVVPWHSSVHLGLGDSFLKFIAVDLPCSVNQQCHFLQDVILHPSRTVLNIERLYIYWHHIPLERVKADSFPTP